MSDLRLMAVHAHPDDETITMGGLLATLADRGVATSLVCCTDGKLATIFAKDMPEESTRPRLAEIRQGELRDAAKVLGIGEVNFLEYGDSGMAGADTNAAPDAFWRADVDEAVGRLVAHIRRFKPQVVMTYNGYGGYGHPDHVQAHRIAVLAVEAAGHRKLYPEAGDPWRVLKLYWSAMPVSVLRRADELARSAGAKAPFGDMAIEDIDFATPDEWVTTIVDCRAASARVRDALRRHHSQMYDDFPFLAMPEDVYRETFGHEHFELAYSRVPTQLPETDVFSGIGEVSVPA